MHRSSKCVSSNASHQTSQHKTEVASERHSKKKKNFKRGRNVTKRINLVKTQHLTRDKRKQNFKRGRYVTKRMNLAKTRQLTRDTGERGPSVSLVNVPSDSDTLSIESGMMDYETMSRAAVDEHQEQRGEIL